MADTAKRLAGPALMAGTATTIYTVPGSTTTVVKFVHIANTSGAAATFRMSIGTDAAGTRVYHDVLVPANDTLHLPVWWVLAAAEIIQAYSSPTNNLTVTVSGVETA